MGGAPDSDGGAHPSRRRQPWWKTALEWLVGLVVIGALVATCGYLGSSCSEEQREGAHAFLEKLREGRAEEAYEHLAPERKRELTLEQFRRLAAHPALAGHTEAGFNTDANEHGPVGGRWHACVYGDLVYQGDDWYIELHMTQRDDGPWLVQEWAVHEPALMVETMLDECRRVR